MDHLTPLDDTFLILERDSLPMHIGSLLVFEGKPPKYEDLLANIAARLDRLPRYRQVIKSVPLNLGPPAWLDDQHFHLSYHIRHTGLPRPGTDEQLQKLASRVISTRLDMERPPWELWLVEGLKGNRFAIINKVHHSMVDGISGNDIMEVLLDDSPDAQPGPISEWEPTPWPDPVSRMVVSIATGIRRPFSRLKHFGELAEVPRAAAKSAAAAVAGTLRLGQELAHTEDHLLGRPGPHRRWAWALGDLQETKRIKNALGGTVNDVILSAVTNGFRTYLLGREVPLTEADFVRSMVPVSTRPPGAPKGGNEVAVLFVDLPVGIADPRDRFEAVKERMREVKNSGLLQGTDSLIANAVFLPPALFTAAGKLAAHTPQPMVSTITTNVPGPQQQLFLMGRPLRRMLPYVPLGMNQLITVAIISYLGQLNCGITADYGRVPDVGNVAAGIEQGLAELSALVAPSE